LRRATTIIMPINNAIVLKSMVCLRAQRAQCDHCGAPRKAIPGIVTLARDERERTIRGTEFHAAATTSRHVVIARRGARGVIELT
jgi:hypothetical protein